MNPPLLGLAYRNNSVSIGSAIVDVLDLKLFIHFRCIKVIQEPTIFPSNINIDIRDIYTSLNVIKVKLHSRPFFFYKRTRLTSYKYTMRPSKQRFIIFIFYYIYIFRASLSRILLYFLFLKKYLFKHRRVSISTKRDFLHVLATLVYQAPSISYQLP
jgi:hypothetical protein